MAVAEFFNRKISSQDRFPPRVLTCTCDGCVSGARIIAPPGSSAKTSYTCPDCCDRLAALRARLIQRKRMEASLHARITERNSARRRRLRALRNGRCTDCGRLKRRSTFRCSACHEKTIWLFKQRRRMWRRQGRCTACGHAKFPEFALCAFCRSRNRDRNNARQRRRISNGLCRRCGQQRGRDGSFCIACLKKHNRGYVELRRKARSEQRQGSSANRG